MKTFILTVTLLLNACFLIGIQAQTNVLTSTFKVYGNCEMCKARIEKAARNVPGVQSAEWNLSAKIISVTYDSALISLDTIREKITAAGHDTDHFRADDKKYNQLPSCCQYERNTGLPPAGNAKKKSIKTVQYNISGMTCAKGCAKRIENTLYKQKGVKSSEVNFDTQIATIAYDESKISKDELVKIIEQCSRDNESIQPYQAVEIKNQ